MSARLHTLANGVRVIADPMPGLETIALAVVAGRGARYEDASSSGWSHLLEHMVFKGAGGRSARDIVEAVEAEGGQINAATAYERTSFQVRALKGGLPLAMEVLSDLVLHPTLSEDDLAREKQVVGQEIAEAADTPDDLVFELAQAKAFGDQPLGRSILGTVESIAAADPGTIGDWRASLYAPDRLIVAASGAIDEDELLALTSRAFGSISGQGVPVTEAGAFTGGMAPTRRDLEQAHLVILLPSVGSADPDYFAVRLFAEALGGGMSSRLFQEAREKRGLAYSIDAYAEAYSDTGVLGVYAGCQAKDAAELARVTAAEIADLASAVTEAELARCKAQLKGHLFMAAERPLVRAEQAAGQTLLFGAPRELADLAAAIDAVTPADMARLGGRLLASRKVAGAVLGPKGAMGAPDAFEKALFG
ncbi:MAG TPA: pitrilysin family protein [Caulobacteraceae bacterium]|nr:pitrilysin family protein [Caulobacteraceae bacterium]